ncbi:unnamed protein product [Rotaria socialis]|uniref:Uncharacterized protein n=1 Tax=Rotaria socialis TaxID=392032 RepID=A0A820W922_9BILA|nr:unnamed protein product [Rotaria socialis]CAF4514328.1 unnamed protein product [Rotaria socialis]
MKQTKGGLMSFNNFLSTSRNRTISLDYARQAIHDDTSMGILFVMAIDPTVCAASNTPFVSVTDEGYFNDNEEEILFSTHTIFRIEQIKPIHDDHTDRLWQVNLTFTGNDDNKLSTLTTHLREDLSRATGWHRFGEILIRLGDPAKAEHLYTILLEAASSDEDRTGYYQQLGRVYSRMGEYSKALSNYERSLQIDKIALSSNHPSLATSYNNIGLVYDSMGKYSKALSNYELSLEIYKIALPPNHPWLATSYNNIASVYYNMGEYAKALSYFEKAHEIWKKSLSPNHPNIATVKENIEIVKEKL